MITEDDFKGEVFYSLFISLQNFYLEDYFFVLREAYSRAIKECAKEGPFNETRFISVFKSWISPGKEQYGIPVYHPLALGLDLLQELYDKLFYLEDMLLKYPDKNTLIITKIELIKSLYSCLSDLGVMSNTEPNKNQKQAFAKLLHLMINTTLYTTEHAAVRQAIKKDDSDTIIFSIGSAGNAAQMLPSFAEQLSGNISVLNFDPRLTRLGNDKIAQHLAELSKDHVSQSYFPINFPSGHEEIGVDSGTTEPINHLKILETIKQNELDAYYDLLCEKKKQNPDFKFVLLYCCSSAFGQHEKQLASRLLDSGLFTLGVDLELVHAYFETSPVVIYRDLGKIERPNHILSTATPNTKIESNYDAERKMFVFQRLNDEVKIFEKLKLSSTPRKTL